MKRRPDPNGDFLPAAATEVRRIYAELATRPVERQCLRRTECCQFKLTGLTPYLTKGEALVAARALRASGRKELP
ncbi:MAG: YkgJ family cysteine cluster protein, partial [Chthoniobacterales bacterium]